ncbi:uncharacterized protein [Diadema setosum]|uniref:uncharacterized protein n=1 Tax=Diadema setosum TaxID=31175 RepID=UPI003B3B59DA
MWLWMFVRGVSGAAAGIMYFYSIQLLDISTAQCLFYLMPVFTAIFARYVEMLALTVALQTENAAVVSVVRSIDILITLVLDIIVLNATANVLKIGGALLVLTSSTGITVTNYFRANPPAMRDK